MAYGVAGPRGGDVGCRPRHADDGHDARRFEFQSLDTEEEKGRTRPHYGRNLQIPSASELFRLFLVGFRDAGGVGECGLLSRVCGGAVEIF